MVALTTATASLGGRRRIFRKSSEGFIQSERARTSRKEELDENTEVLIRRTNLESAAQSFLVQFCCLIIERVLILYMRQLALSACVFQTQRLLQIRCFTATKNKSQNYDALPNLWTCSNPSDPSPLTVCISKVPPKYLVALPRQHL